MHKYKKPHVGEVKGQSASGVVWNRYIEGLSSTGSPLKL